MRVITFLMMNLINTDRT